MNDIENLLKNMRLKQPSSILDDRLNAEFQCENETLSFSWRWVAAASVSFMALGFLSGILYRDFTSPKVIQVPSMVKVYVVPDAKDFNRMFDLTANNIANHEYQINITNIGEGI